MFLVSSFTNLSNYTRSLPADTKFEPVDNQSNHADRSSSATSSTRSTTSPRETPITNSTSSSISSRPSGLGSASSVPVRLAISEKRSKRRRNKKVHYTGYHPRCLPRSIEENKKISYHLRIEKILSDKSLQLFRPQLLCEVCNTQSNSKKQLQSHFNSKNHQAPEWKLTPKHCATCGTFSRLQTSRL